MEEKQKVPTEASSLLQGQIMLSGLFTRHLCARLWFSPQTLGLCLSQVAKKVRCIGYFLKVVDICYHFTAMQKYIRLARSKQGGKWKERQKVPTEASSVAGPDYGEWTFHQTLMLICSDIFKDIYTSDFCRKDAF